MSTYKYQISNYHAIQYADIELKGITVLSGVNGCGKSTISRWLYYIVNVINRFDELCFNKAKSQLVNALQQYFKIYELINSEKEIVSVRTFWETYDSVLSLNYQNRSSLELLFDNNANCENEFEKALAVFFDHPELRIVSQGQEYRIWNALKLRDMSGSYLDRLTAWHNQVIEDREQMKGEFLKMSTERSISHLASFISSEYGERDEYPGNIDLLEDGVSVLTSKVGMLLGLDRAIYIDTPMAVTSMDNNPYWQDLKEMLTTSSNKGDFSKFDEIGKRINEIIGGTISSKSDMISKELYFKSVNGEEIKLKSAATGIKTFAYLFQLLKNGYLNEKSLLIIDEPEAHLHPQWIVDFAKILIVLHKQLGVKILLASHNPDMVAALQSSANKEDLQDEINFNIAKPGDNGKYCFFDLGNDIAEIFDSFNIALDKIEEMGGEDE